jgi:FkbM family methyltransferase
MRRLAHYYAQLRERGLKAVLLRRFHWYKIQISGRPEVGWLVELFGDCISLGGVKLSLDNPLIPTAFKGHILFGFYEEGERQLATRYLDAALPTVEIGGAIGVVSCTVSKLLNDPAAFVVIECSPPNLTSLTKNRNLNGCKFSIEPKALAYGSDVIAFNIDTFHAGTIHGESKKQIVVPTTTISEILKKYKFDRINLIADCEGAEVDLVINELDVLRDRVKWFIVEVHPTLVGAQAVNDMLEILTRCGFAIKEQYGNQVIAFENTALSD